MEKSGGSIRWLLLIGRWAVLTRETIWGEKELIGIEFLSLSKKDKVMLQQLCREHVTLALGD